MAGLACATMPGGPAAGQVVVAACGPAVQGPVLLTRLTRLTRLIRWFHNRGRDGGPTEPAPSAA